MKQHPARTGLCLSDFAIDRWRAGELEDAAAAKARAHVDGCDGCRERLAMIQRAAEEFLRVAPPRPRSNSSTSSPSRSKRARSAAVAGAGAALLAVAGVLLYPRLAPAPEAPVDTVRLKGADHLGFYVRHDGGIRPGYAGDSVLPGDQLRFTVSMSRPRYVAVLSVDGAGVGSVYFPGPGTDRATRILPGLDVALSSSVELDGTIGAERVFGLFCDDPLPLEPLRKAFEEHVAAPAGCNLDEIGFTKVAPR